MNAVIDPVDIASELRPVLLRIARELRHEVRDLGVTGGQVSLLVQISRNRGIGTCDLAELEGVSAPRISKAVDALVLAGLVGRHRGIDRRRVGFEITAKGRSVLQSVRKRRTAWLAARLKQLEPGDLGRIEAAVEPLARLLAEPV
jgi:DNA-binding MarR family transcriptional regulator